MPDKTNELAGKLAKAAQAVNTPDRNARTMFINEGFWQAVATAILEAVGPQAEKADPEVSAVSEEDDYVDLDELKEKAPKKRGRRK
jgi:hypothetical protein